MRKSGLTRGSPNLVILCLRKGVSLRKIRFLQKDTFGADCEHDTCPWAKESRRISFGRDHAEGLVVMNTNSVHVAGGHWRFNSGINKFLLVLTLFTLHDLVVCKTLMVSGKLVFYVPLEHFASALFWTV
ncbi:hypothetical protein L3X38_010962 [Prunus dulcis]|uniref:Uncharacterized protein n=1 Tax=Prunus dulcis TaxID=3755 RepID=A0AAD4ZEX8_PRUDU|nr:hypothetical protein L3X38_010962 [Prunus dulcis]